MSPQSHPSPLSRRRDALSQYRHLIREIREDKLRLAQLSARLLRLDASGLPAPEHSEEDTAAYRNRIAENLDKCIAMVEELQAYINGIEDSEVRHIFTLRYIHAYSWQRIAIAIGGTDESYARKKHDRYIEKNP